MSLQAHALAICAAGALIEKLPAWVHVALEPHEPLALADQVGTLVVAVFIGDERTKVQGRQWSRGSTSIELVVQVILPVEIEAQLGGAVCKFDTRGGGTRPLYAMVHEAVRRAFTAPPDGGWGELLQGVFVGHPEDITGIPGKAERPSVPPVPVLDYSIPCQVIMPPAYGVPVPYPWSAISAKMRTDPLFTPAEADFFDALAAGEPLDDERALLALAGVSRREGVALGLAWSQAIDPAPNLVEATLQGPLGDVVETYVPPVSGEGAP